MRGRRLQGMGTDIHTDTDIHALGMSGCCCFERPKELEIEFVRSASAMLEGRSSRRISGNFIGQQRLRKRARTYALIRRK